MTTEVALDPSYSSPEAEQAILQELQVALYRFLNPLTGGPQGEGWPFGTPVYPSDIITLLQTMTGVRYLGAVSLYEIRQQRRQRAVEQSTNQSAGQNPDQETEWVRRLAPDNVGTPDPLGLICSWNDSQLSTGHTIRVIH